MGIKVTKIVPKGTVQIADLPIKKEKKRVAAYARVSTDSDEQFTSFEAQVSYYTDMIKSNADWEFVKVFTDEGISGTMRENRKGFNEMMESAKKKEFDMIITKSISRFARNTVDLISCTRELKSYGVDVYFEEQRLHSLDPTGEMLLTILGSIAQEESRNISENVSWGIRKRFQDGKIVLGYKTFLGFEKGEDGRPKIIEEEAEIVKLIYQLFLEGETTHTIARYLNEHQIPMPSKKKDKNGNYVYNWQVSTVLSILTNEKYKGEAILQKSITVDFLTHKHVKNDGREIPQYHVQNSHEAIIPIEDWEMVQIELNRRGKLQHKYTGGSIFSSKIICGDCGAFYGAKVWHSNDRYRKVVYHCNDKFNGKKCTTPTLSEEEIKTAFIKSFNMIDKTNLIEDCDTAIETILQMDDIDEEIDKLTKEANGLVEKAKKMVELNASSEVDQEEHDKKYKKIQDRYDEIEKKLVSLNDEKGRKVGAAQRIKMFALAISKNGEALTEFNKKLWTMLIESVTVYKDRRLRFKYYSGYENEVEL